MKVRMLKSTLVSDKGELGTAERIGPSSGGGSLDPLTTPATASEIVDGYEAYSDQGAKITGSLVVPVYADGNEVSY